MSGGLHFISFEKTNAPCNIRESDRLFSTMHVLCSLHNLWQLTQPLVIISIFNEPITLNYASMLHTCYTNESLPVSNIKLNFHCRVFLNPFENYL